VTDTATIIDFNAYRSRQQARRSNWNSLEQRRAPHQFTATAAAVPLLWFWPTIVWMPVFMPAGAATKRELS